MSSTRLPLRLGLGAAAAAALVLGACTADPTGALHDAGQIGASLTVGTNPGQGNLEVCKVGPLSSFTNTPAGLTGGAFDLEDGCVLVITGANTATDPVVSEVSSAGTFDSVVVEQFVAFNPNPGSSTTLFSPTDVTTRISNDIGAVMTFFNTRLPDRGDEGCTPGFWKNHSVNAPGNQSDEWVTYTAGQYFDDVFGAGPHVTLITALNTGGGGANALGRHAVAALLNAASSVDYWYSEAEVIAIVQDAYDIGTKDAFNAAKDLLEVRNEAGCPLPANGVID